MCDIMGIQGKKEKTKSNMGLPKHLKEGVENSTGISMNDVKVHYNSSMPSRINALAYTQGTQIYIAPGQEKHLPHETWHVVQQKQGRVSPTGRIKGVPVNEDIALEREADRFQAGKYLGNNLKAGGIGAVEAPVQMVKGEENSVFDIEKLRLFIKKLIERNIKQSRKAWIGNKVEGTELDNYTEKVQTLLEDIRQVDLQFLAATAVSYEEEGLTEDSGYDNVLTDEEKQRFGDNKDIQNRYKIIIAQKLNYMKKLENQMEVQLQCRDEQRKELHRRYLIAVANHGRARKPKIVHSLKKVADKLEEELEKEKEKINIMYRYLSDVKKQIIILKDINEKANGKGYVFNINSLLIETDKKIKIYMAIVAPSKIYRFKDISLDDSGKLNAYSKQMQFGIGTPVRSFSWYLKYLMDPSANANNTPVIRSVSITPELFDGWHHDMVSEAYKNDTMKNMPMNEDYKVPNQFGTPVSSKVFQELLNSHPALTTIGEGSSMPEKLKEGAGNFEEFNRFKKEIGFERLKGGVRTSTDVHFFDFEHTAFHVIKDKGKPNLYTPKEAREMYMKYSNLMDAIIGRIGKSDYVNSGKEKGLIKGTLSDEELKDKVTVLLEANHCMPENRNYDLHGNDKKALKTEEEFANNYIAKEESEENVKMLINLTRERYKLWYNEIEQEYKKKKNNEKKIDNIRWKISQVKYNSGLIYELQEMEKIDNKFIMKFPVSDKNIESFFNNLENVLVISLGGKLHVTAFCFKLLRLIKSDNQGVQTLEKGKLFDNETEKRLFSERSSGDYFDVLNRHEGKNITIKEEEVFIPFDKMTSTGRFKPKGDAPKNKSIPFIGGASGTTRDISRDLLSKELLKDEDEYWKFQILNASFMILYSYHSFVEVIYRAATTRMEYYGEERVSKYIVKYLKDLSLIGYMPASKNIIADINYIINKKQEIDTSGYKKFSLRPKIKYKKIVEIAAEKEEINSPDGIEETV